MQAPPVLPLLPLPPEVEPAPVLPLVPVPLLLPPLPLSLLAVWSPTGEKQQPATERTAANGAYRAERESVVTSLD